MEHPPKWIIRFIHLYCPPQLAEGVIGDVWEQYLKDKKRHSSFKAKRRLLWNALRFFRPGILLRNSKTKLINKAMLRINLLLALRNMRKYKFYSIINVLGLAMAISFGLLVFFYIQNAIKHDTFHEEHESIFRFTRETRDLETGELVHWSNTTSNRLAEDLKNEIPSIEHISRLISGQGYVKHASETFKEKVMLVDPDFFQMFSFPVIEGNKNYPLSGISQVVISPHIAEKYFGPANPIGKEIEITVGNEYYKFIVSAVVDPVQELNSLPFDLVIHIDHLKHLISDPSFLNTYDVSYLETYMKLNNSQEVAYYEKLITETYIRLSQTSDSEDRPVIKLQPISKLYWWSNKFPDSGEAKTYNPDYVYILSGLCLLVLIIAVLNFIMLTSSQSFNRVKEFGIKKTMGAYKSQVSSQLLLEVFLLASLAGFTAVLVTYHFIPIFNSLANTTLNFSLGLEVISFILILISSISIISSIISSGVILKLSTTNALKGNLTVGGDTTRNVMIVIQFTMCIGLIVGTITFRNQMHFINNKSLGFEKDQLIEVNLPENANELDSEKYFERFQTELKKHSSVTSVSAVMTTMEYPWTRFGFVQDDESIIHINFNLVTPDYLNTMRLELTAGRNFREDDTGKSIIVNEALVEKLGWEDPLGKQIPGDFKTSHEVIGIVKDFNFNSLHNEVTPLILATEIDHIWEGVNGISSYVWPPQYFTALIKVGPGNLKESTQTIKHSWATAVGNIPLEMKYVNDILNDKYEEEERYSSIINYAAGFSLFIAWLGLLALTRLMIQKRFKEMGIRKVLGSTPFNIILLVAKKFMLLISIATLLATPVSWWLLQNWLGGFAYRINLSSLVFITAGLSVIAFTFISISIQSIKVSNINPSKVLRMD